LLGLNPGDRLAALDVGKPYQKSSPQFTIHKASAAIDHRSRAWRRGARELNEVVKGAHAHEPMLSQRHERDAS
jgi:hypothetical protein